MPKIGDTVTWFSSNTKKTGTIIDFIEAGKDAMKALQSITNYRYIPLNRIKFGGYRSVHDRYIIEVPRGGQSVLSDYYAPIRSVVDKCVEGKEVK